MLRNYFYGILTLGIVLASCDKEDDIDRLGDVDFSRPAAVGGSMMAGYQDGALYTKGQEHSIPALFYKQIEQFGGGTFTLPLIENEEVEGVGLHAKPWAAPFQKRNWLRLVIDDEGNGGLEPQYEVHSSTNLPDLQNNYSSLNGQYQCVPFATTEHLTNPTFGLSFDNGNPNPFYHRWAANPGSSTPVSELADYAPSFLMAWLGIDDVYNYALAGGHQVTLPSAAKFRENAEEILEELVGENTKGVLATIPDLDNMPFFNLVAYNALDLDDPAQVDLLNTLFSTLPHVSFQVGPNPFLIADASFPNGVRQITAGEKILFTLPRDSIPTFLYGIQNPFHPRYVLDALEVSQIKTAISEYNAAIRSLADKYDFALYDANAFFADVKSGIQYNGADFSLTFASGGFLSLDGLNPNQKGYALLTNGFIAAVNSKYGTNIPNVNCKTCDGVLFP